MRTGAPERADFPRIGIIGCGAVTEFRHLPALAALGMRPAVLVDTNVARARELAKSSGALHAGDRYEPWAGEIDAAIVALPHHLHAPVAIDLLRKGIHVLVEKPLAMDGAQCEAVIAAAAESGKVLAVGLMRRFLYGARWLKGALDAKVFGPITSFDVREGFVYGWPVASSFFFRRETSGGGVLADLGAHTLDLLLWWLGEPEAFEYYDDSYGGVEADCKLELETQGGAEGIVELSRTRRLRNSAIFRGPAGEVEISLDEKRLNVLSAKPAKLLSHEADGLRGDRLPPQLFRELFQAQIRDWVEAIRSGGSPRVPGAEGKRAILLTQACYAKRRLWELPWVHPTGAAAPAAVGGR
jgi:predicted dehydrogenase